MANEPKIQVNPSTTQARILRGMLNRPGVGILWNNSQARFAGNGSYELEEQVDGLKSSTVRKMVREGWLEANEEGSPFYQLSERGKEVAGGLQSIDLRKTSMAAAQSMTAEVVLRALRDAYPEPYYVVLSEVFVSGFNRFIDAVAFCVQTEDDRRFSANEYLNRISFEIKVDRQDFKSELEEPSKRLGAMELSTHFAFAAPVGMIDLDEVPENCGLVEVDQYGTLSVAIAPPRLSGLGNPSWEQVAALFRSRLKEG